MSRAEQMPRMKLEDLSVDMQALASYTSSGVRGGEVALTHEGTHAAAGQTTTPPFKWSGIICILIG